MAPKLIKLASTPKRYINDRAKSKLRGITEATTRPERQDPSKTTTTKMTIKQPKIKFSAMVNVVFSISSLRSKNGLMETPSGSMVCTSATRCFTEAMTSWALAPLSIMTCPITASP